MINAYLFGLKGAVLAAAKTLGPKFKEAVLKQKRKFYIEIISEDDVTVEQFKEACKAANIWIDNCKLKHGYLEYGYK